MTLDEKIAAVVNAEARCQQQRDEADRTLAHLKSELRRTATPVRIVVSGLAVGFAAGLRKPGGDGGAGSLLSGPLFSMVVESVLPGLLAGVTAAVTGAVQDEAEDEEQDETAADSTPPEPRAPGPAEPQAAAETTPPPRKKRRADSAA
jgi:hypothetical protein